MNERISCMYVRTYKTMHKEEEDDEARRDDHDGW
jgi:hypothetical protein